MRPDRWRRCLAEGLGTGLLSAVVIGSGITAARLSPGDAGLQLLETAAVTAAGLAALIVAFGAVSGAHFNPLVTLADCAFGGLAARDAVVYIPSQVVGACGGAVVANVMFSEPAFQLSHQVRSGGGLWLAEVVATVGLLLVIRGAGREERPATIPFAVGGYIGAAYFFTSSTSFANPAVTVSRALSDTFAGIDPVSVPAFVGFQCVGLAVAVALAVALHPGAAGRGHAVAAAGPDRAAQ